MEEQVIVLEDGDFWRDPLRDSLKVSRSLAKADFSGVKIAAPKFVPLDVRDTLPLVVYRAGSFADLATLKFAESALLTSVNLDNGEVHVDYAVEQDFIKDNEDPDLANLPSGRGTEKMVIDVRQMLDLPWHPATYLLTIIMREHVSNRVQVQLDKSKLGYHDQEVAKALDRERAQMGAPPPYPAPASPYPNYQALTESPPIPKGSGINLVADRVVVLRENARCILRGSYRLPARENEIMKGKETWAQGKTTLPTSVVGISLLITGGDHASPALVRLAIPNYEPLDPAAKLPLVSGHFALDLLTLPKMPRTPQTYFLYAFSGDVLVGPVLSALVPEGMLPRGDQ